jgi:NAD(P)-dependent dehydrogenase (short-subunit alcohol dehydrogenase family)
MGNPFSYEGKRVVVTGAASGMGNATVKYLADVGAQIVALDVQQMEDGPWTPIQVNLADRASVDAAVEAIGGPVDGLFNVAGVAGGRGQEKLAMMVNFFGLRYLTERLLPVMPRGAAIVNVSSLAGYRYVIARAELEPMLRLATMEEASAWLDRSENEERFNGYGTSKELLNLWTVTVCKALAEERGIRINVVAPGTTDTPLLPAFRQNAIDRTGSDDRVLHAKGFFGRLATSEDQAAACVFLCSDAASLITGQILAVDGGMAGAMTGGSLPTPAPRGR